MTNTQPIETIIADAREVYSVFGKASRALEIVEKALLIDPRNVEALNLKAAVLYELDRDEEAQQLHEQVLTIEPNSVEAMHGLAALANDHTQYDRAISFADRGLRAIELDPHPELIDNEDYRQRLLAELYNEKAFAFWYQDKQEEAISLLTEEGPSACPMEIETFEEQLDWLEQHPDTPDE